MFTTQEPFAMPGYHLTPIDRSGIDKKNLCPKCDELLREAVQTIACGHRYCKACVEDILRYVKVNLADYRCKFLFPKKL